MEEKEVRVITMRAGVAWGDDGMQYVDWSVIENDDAVDTPAAIAAVCCFVSMLGTIGGKNHVQDVIDTIQQFSPLFADARLKQDEIKTLEIPHDRPDESVN